MRKPWHSYFKSYFLHKRKDGRPINLKAPVLSRPQESSASPFLSALRNKTHEFFSFLCQGRFIMSNKVARTIAFFYTLLVHLLVFLVSRRGGEGACKLTFSRLVIDWVSVVRLKNSVVSHERSSPDRATCLLMYWFWYRGFNSYVLVCLILLMMPLECFMAQVLRHNCSAHITYKTLRTILISHKTSVVRNSLLRV